LNLVVRPEKATNLVVVSDLIGQVSLFSDSSLRPSSTLRRTPTAVRAGKTPGAQLRCSKRRSNALIGSVADVAAVPALDNRCCRGADLMDPAVRLHLEPWREVVWAGIMNDLAQGTVGRPRWRPAAKGAQLGRRPVRHGL
jgi:hypothetical protein